MLNKTMKLTLLSAIVSLLAVGVPFAQHEGHDHGKMMEKEGHGKMMKKEVTMTGEILDMYCFMAHPEDGQGPEHAKCATSCINKGLPIGFLVGGEVYLITGKDHEPTADMVAEYAGMQSTITGTLITHHGVKAIEIASIKPAS
jgi:hypothetical protein